MTGNPLGTRPDNQIAGCLTEVANLMKALGVHVIAEFYDCDPTKLDGARYMDELLLRAARESGATILESSCHQFSPQGVSGVVIISESHFTIHTWPEYSYAAVDIFTCGESINNEIALEILKEGMGAQMVSVTELKRGHMSQVLGHTRGPKIARNSSLSET